MARTKIDFPRFLKSIFPLVANVFVAGTFTVGLLSGELDMLKARPEPEAVDPLTAVMLFGFLYLNLRVSWVLFMKEASA